MAQNTKISFKLRLFKPLTTSLKQGYNLQTIEETALQATFIKMA
jgi:hypothetical protein